MRADDWISLATRANSVEAIIDAVRLPPELLRGSYGPSPHWAIRETLGSEIAASKFTQSLLGGLTCFDEYHRDRGPSYTAPVSRQFFPPRWRR